MLGDPCNITLDDAGRFALPRHLRGLFEDKIVLTWGADSSLWLFSMEEWKAMEQMLMENKDANPFDDPERIMRQHFIGSKRELEIDKQGRMVIPPPHRDYAALSKDGFMFGQPEYMEIWSRERYRAHLDANKADFKAGLKELGARMVEKRKQGNG